MSGPTSSTVTSAPGATVSPYIQQGLQAAQQLYQQGPIQPYAGQRYVSPSEATQQALQMAQTRATAGSPLSQAALQQQQNVVGGQYLGMNPFFQGAFAAAKAPIEEAFQNQIANITSQASRAGRYGSGAAQQLQERAATGLARELSNIGGTLAFRGYESERARQEAAAQMAPTLAQTEYQDINKLLAVGQGQEAYEQARIASEMQKYNEQQMAPYAALQSFLGSVYGAPAGQTVSTQYETDPLMQSLGAAIAGGAVLGSDGSLNIPAAAATGLLTFLGLKKP
jgi:hypothetical protein